LHPATRPAPLHRHTVYRYLQCVRVGETGFEPATARPPAGSIWLTEVGFGGVVRLRAGRSCPQLRSLCTPDCTPSDPDRDQHPSAQPSRAAALAHLRKRADRRRCSSHLVRGRRVVSVSRDARSSSLSGRELGARGDAGLLSKEQWRLGSLRVSAAAAAPVTVAKRERDAPRALTDRRTAPTSPRPRARPQPHYMERGRSSNDAVPKSLTRLTEHRDAGASADTTYGRAPGVRVRASPSGIIPSTTEPTHIATAPAASAWSCVSPGGASTRAASRHSSPASPGARWSRWPGPARRARRCASGSRPGRPWRRVRRAGRAGR
jgi:hypothetical protein